VIKSLKFTVFFLILLFLGITSCSQSADQPVSKHGLPESGLKILTTIPPLYSFTKNIVQEHAEVSNLLPSGVGPHEYSFSPADLKKIAEADIIIKNGANLEAWLKSAIASAGREELIVIDTSSGVDIINDNPHIWLSPKRAIVQVNNIKEALIRAKPGLAGGYSTNADNYIRRLDVLDSYIREEIRTWREKKIVTLHPAFLYFTVDYGLKLAAVIQESPEHAPSPKHIGNVINTIKDEGMKSVFSERQSSQKLVRALAGDLDLQVYILDTLETGEFSLQWYEEKIRGNLEVLKKALK
jgi:zinc/manganese transport system substrate-binding protein